MTSDEDVSRPPPPQASISPQVSVLTSTSAAQSPQISAIPQVTSSEVPQAEILPATSRSQRQSGGKKVKVEDLLTKCDQCEGPGSKENLVR